ncbi:MAG: HAMP domain-containing sensor histidine kinase [Angelakisella sp.]|nr:HAMP domain-containing sensor histidine kinase [Angelakisella sp.]
MPESIFDLIKAQFEDATFAVILTDLDLKIIYTNKYAEEMSRALDISDGMWLLIPSNELEQCRQNLREGKGARLFSSPIRSASCCFSVTPLHQGDTIVGAFVTIVPYENVPTTPHDAVSGASSSLLSTCFRYPLSQIFASLAVMLRKLHATDNHTVDEAISVINQNSYMMLRNINNIVERIRFNSVSKPEVKVVNLWEQMAELLEAVDITLRPNGYHLLYSLPEGQDCVSCNFEQIAVALLNILSNACKAGGKGSSISITGRKHGSLAIVTVTDTGSGIPQEIINSVFDPFYSWNKDAHTPPAMGLGLNVAKQIIYESGGTLAVHSREGDGTAVAFTLPLLPDAQPDARMPLDCGSSAYLLDHFSPVYWVLSDIIVPPNQ